MPQVSYSEAAQAGEEIYTDTDADLVTQLRAGDETAIAHLVDEWSPTMLRVARSFVDSPQSAEDVVQDTWLGMLSGLAKFEGRSSLRTWAFSILVNRARTRGAREARTLTWSPLGPEEGPAIDDRIEVSGGEHPWKWTSIHTPSRWDTRPESVVLSKEVLAREHHASSATVAKALASLRAEGLIITRHGWGPFVAVRGGTPDGG
jgi:RNA polymerase sigma-70 factor, ECF subfamily